MAAELESSDKDKAQRYRSESDKAESYVANLKKLVKESSPTGFYDNYTTPEEGAKLVYTELRSYFERMFAKSDKAETQAPEIFDHVRYLKRNAVESFIGGDKLFAKIDEFADRLAGSFHPPMILRLLFYSSHTHPLSLW